MTRDLRTALMPGAEAVISNSRTGGLLASGLANGACEAGRYGTTPGPQGSSVRAPHPPDPRNTFTGSSETDDRVRGGRMACRFLVGAGLPPGARMIADVLGQRACRLPIGRDRS